MYLNTSDFGWTLSSPSNQPHIPGFPINGFSFQVRKRIISQLTFPITDYADILSTKKTLILSSNPTIIKPYCAGLSWGVQSELTTASCMTPWIGFILNPGVSFTASCFCLNNSIVPPYLKQFLLQYSSPYPFRHMDYPFFTVSKIHKEIGRRSFKYKAPSVWNNLPSVLKSITFSFFFSFFTFRANWFSHLTTSCSCFWHNFLLY